MVTEQALVDDLAPSFGLEPGSVDLKALIAHLQAGPERVVLVDEAHNVFLRTNGGFKAFDALVKLVNATSDRVFWALVFNRYSWTFINQTRKRVHYFRRLLNVPTWSADELQKLIAARNMRTGFEIEFDEMLLDTPPNSTGSTRSSFSSWPPCASTRTSPPRIWPCASTCPLISPTSPSAS